MKRSRSSARRQDHAWPNRLLSVALFSVACSALAQEPPAAKAASPESILDTADNILRQMSRITGLPIKSPLKKRLIGKPEIEKYLKDNLHDEYTPQDLHGEEAALKAFGLVGPEFNLENFLVSFYTEQAAGFYDPVRKTMFMADWVEPDQQKMVLAHELTHALQDQSFDLWKFMHAARDDDDSTTAREALVEGYAMVAMVQAMMGTVAVEKLSSLDATLDQVVGQQMAAYPVFSKAPFFLRFETLFPYVQGMHFVLAGLQNGGWSRVNQTFGEPPASTNQIFQPGLYFESSHDETRAGAGTVSGRSQPGLLPLALPPPAALEHAAGLKRVEANVMGELGYYALVGQFISPEEAQKTTTAWVADRYLVYEGPSPGQFVLIARTRWTNAQAARNFCEDYRAVLGRKSPGMAQDADRASRAKAGPGSGSEVLLQTAGPRRSILIAQENECRWAEGVPSEQADGIAKWLTLLH